MAERKKILFGDNRADKQWVAQYTLGYAEFDDNIESTDVEEILFEADDFETAVRYAQQYLRKMQAEEQTAEQWKDASILSVELY